MPPLQSKRRHLMTYFFGPLPLGRCAKSEAATRFSVVVDLELRKTLLAAVPAFLPVATVHSVLANIA